MKRSVNKRGKNKTNSELIHKLIIIFCALLITLILIWILIIIFSNVSKQEEGKQDKYSSLGTEGVFSSDVVITGYDEDLITLHDFYSNDEKSIITIIRSDQNSGSLNKVIVIFNRTDSFCSYNITSQLPTTIIPAVYYINASETDCGNNFTGIVDVDSYGIRNQITMDLTQKSIIPDINLAFYENKSGAIDLDNYFTNLTTGDPGLNFIYSSSPGVILTPAADFVNSRKIDINITTGSRLSAQTNITLNYPNIASVSSNNFFIYIGANCSDSDLGQNYSLKGITSNFSFSGTDYCYNSTSLIEYFCNGSIVSNNLLSSHSNNYCYDGTFLRNISINTPPSYLARNCNLTNRSWYKNENLTLELSLCFNDNEDDDNLTYETFYRDNNYLTIIKNNSVLHLIPAYNWVGNGSFYAYASDGINETTGIVYFTIKDTNLIINNTNTTIINNTNPIIINESLYNNSTFGIKDPSPRGDTVTDFFGNNQTFFISNLEYDSIEWYLNGKIVKTNSNSCEFKGLSIGNYTVEVKLKKGTNVDSKIWKVIIQGDEKSRKFLFDAGLIMFILIIVVIGIIICLIVWLFIVENNKKNRRIDLDIDVMRDDKTLPGLSKKDDMSRRFNIPK